MTILRTEREDRAIIRAWWDAEERGDKREADRLIRMVNDVCLCGGPALPDSMQATVDTAREARRAPKKPKRRGTPEEPEACCLCEKPIENGQPTTSVAHGAHRVHKACDDAVMAEEPEAGT